MKDLEKYLWLASIISLITLVHYQLSIFNIDYYDDPEYMESTFSLSYWSVMLVGYAHQVVSAFWLYQAAKKESLSKLAWAVFGLSFGFIAIAVFYSASIYFILSSNKISNDSLIKKA